MTARFARSAPASLLLLPLAAACTPAESVTPPPASTAPTVAEPATPTPTASPTPTQQELSAQAEKAYRTASEEMERLGREGGSTEASPLLRSVVAERALVKYETLLKDQKQRGYTIAGNGSVLTRPAPGDASRDSDPRLSVQVCDDRSSVKWSENGQAYSGYPVQGWAYGRIINGGVMIVDLTTSKVERCDLS